MKTAICPMGLTEKMKSRLSELGFKVITLAEMEELSPSALATHTDMILCLMDNVLITSRSYYMRHRELFSHVLMYSPNIKIRLTASVPMPKYPKDAIFNALVMGRRVFMKCDTASEEIYKEAQGGGYSIINTKQGYPACTVLALSDTAAITADPGMARLLSLSGIDVTLIKNSEKIKLSPYTYGFIGGCAGVVGDTVCFAGNLDAHPEADIIKSAILKAGKSWTSLDTGCDFLLDVGGIKFL